MNVRLDERIMPPTKPDTKKESWLRRRIRGWRTLVADVLYWGSLAIREIVDNWCLAIRPDGKVAGGDHVADQGLQEKRDNDTNGDVP
jgi:hypothetical protein